MRWNEKRNLRFALVTASFLPILALGAIGMVMLGLTLAQDPQPNTPPENSGRRSVDEIVNDLRKDDPAAPVSRNINRGGERENGRRTKLVPENTVIARRLGRVVRAGNEAEWLFAFEADNDGISDPPMVLMPCRTLERAEAIAEEQGDSARFVVSGRIYVYHERNYLLPTVMRLARDQENLSP